MRKPKTPAPNKPKAPESVEPSLLAEFQGAAAQVNATADAAEAAVAEHRNARVVFEYVGSKIRDTYDMGANDRILPNGTIERAPKDV